MTADREACAYVNERDRTIVRLRAENDALKERDKTRGETIGCLYRQRRAVEKENERLREALRSISTYVSGSHNTIGEACGADLCLVCLIDGTALGALAGACDEIQDGEDTDG